MDQLDMFGSPPEYGETIKITNGEYIYMPNFFDRQTSNEYLSAFIKNIEWNQESMNMYGKQVNFPRLTAWYGDNDKPYSFSGITLNPHPWNKELLEIKNKIEPKCEVSFNSVLLNLYRDGSDSISWHTDAEKELGKNPLIASVNFGAERKFQIRHNETKETIEIILNHGSLLIMKGELQHFWKHQVPKTKTPLKERVNLTFRVIK
jgi:alkylated DNA repair dioxygenase AlkB